MHCENHEYSFHIPEVFITAIERQLYKRIKTSLNEFFKINYDNYIFMFVATDWKHLCLRDLLDIQEKIITFVS